MSDLDLSRYPVNDRGFTVLPCVPLSSESMEEWMIGFKVTVGLGDSSSPTQAGVLISYDETHMKIKIGTGKAKKFAYDPEDIQLQCYQFEKRVLFSNESVSHAKDDSSED